MSDQLESQGLVFTPQGSALTGKLLRTLSPRLIPGIHYAFNGPVQEAVNTVGNLSTFDLILMRVYTLFGMPNPRLENKLRAIGIAFQKEAELLELNLA